MMGITAGSRWKGALLGVAVAACLSASSAHASMISYTSTGTFTAGTDATVSGGGSVITITDPGNPSRFVTVTYTPTTATVNTPVVANLGTFTVNASSITGSRLDVPVSPVASTFSLKVQQTGPTSGSSTFMSTVDGSVSFNGGYIEVSFANTTINIGSTTFTLVNLTNNVPIFPNNTLLLDPTATGGQTTVKAYITGGAVPEPSSVVLALGGGLGLLGFGVRKRIRNG